MYNLATGWLGSLDYLKPGEGYMFNTGKTGLLTYPESGIYEKSARAENQATSLNVTGWNYNSGQYSSNMSVIAKVFLPDNSVSGDEWYLGAFAGSECRGIASAKLNPLDSHDNYFLTVSGNSQAENIRFKMVNVLNGKSLNIKQAIGYSPDAIAGTLKEPVILNALEEKSSELPTKEPEYTASPNPFNSSLKISAQSPEKGKLIIQVYNSLGVQVDVQQTTVNAGYNTIEWNNDYCSKFLPGTYYIKFIFNEQVKVLMVVKE